MKTYEILVIGGGPAGITIAKMLGKKMKIGVIRPEDYSMIYCAMPYAIEKIIPIEKTFKKDDIVTEAGADLIRDKVDKIDYKNKKVITEKGETYYYEKLVLATGAIPVLPPVPGRDLKRVMTFKTEDDLRAILNYSEQEGISKAVVVGAGAIGVELSQALNAADIETHLVDMADTILSSMMDSDMVEEAEAELIKLGIHLHLNNKVVKLEGENSVSRVILENGKSIDLADGDECTVSKSGIGRKGLVVFAVGMTVEGSLFENSGLNIGKDGIIVNEKMETNVEGVYAVGDCTQYSSGITGDIISGKLATNAVPMAKIFARNILGEEAAYSGFFNGAATKVGTFFVGGTGLTENKNNGNNQVMAGYSELTTIFPNMPGAKKIRMKMLVDSGTLRIIGAQFVSGEPVTDKVDIITLAIQNKLKVTDLADLSYSSQPYQSYFPASNLVVAAAEDILKKAV